MAFVRSIGRWTMTALVINCIIGGGIFGLPGELTRLLGRASPFAMIFAALGMAVIMACIAEVASQFSEPGGPYLYTRTAFGRFVGIEIGWFHLLAVIGGEAALANLFINHLAIFVPGATNSGNRVLIVATLVVVPAAANYLGVRSGANFSTLMTLAKVSPLALLILFGLVRFAQSPRMIHASEVSAPKLANWMTAMVLLLFVFGGWEDALIPTGEVREPRRTIPFGLGAGLLSYAAICTLLQFITVSTIGTRTTDRPLAETASVLLGRGGEAYVAIAVMLSTYGAISASFLNVPRLAYSFAAQGDFPALLATLHPRFQTPVVAIWFYTFTVWALASSGTFIWLVAVSSGSSMVLYGGVCASLFRLRKIRPRADALRIPHAPAVGMVAIAICLALMTALERRELLLMCVTALIAAANWLWARRRYVSNVHASA